MNYPEPEIMTKNGKILLGLATIWPLVYLAIFITAIFSIALIYNINGARGEFISDPPLLAIGLIIIIHLMTAFGIIGLVIFYILNIVKNDSVSQNKKAPWLIGLFFASVIVMPIYWYLHIWRDSPTTNQPTEPTTT
jgi:hypothetical protein